MTSNKRVIAKEIANLNPLTAMEDSKLVEVAGLMLKSNSSYVIILHLENKNPLGIMTEKDFVKLIASGDYDDNTTIAEAMSTPLRSVGPNATADECLDFMKKYGVKHLPIVGDGELQGVITLKKLLFLDSSFIVETHPIVLYLINKHDGALIFEYNFKDLLEKDKISGDLFTGALSSFNIIIPEILGSKGKLNFIEIEDLKILIEHGECSISILIQDKESIDARKRLKSFSTQFERRYQGELEDYNCKEPIDIFNDAKEIVERIFASKMKIKKGERIS
ncbi:MAG: cyclic nucleotide-binding/CBS domain-containing protein [Candidatus Hodarchaeota archaeon]